RHDHREAVERERLRRQQRLHLAGQAEGALVRQPGLWLLALAAPEPFGHHLERLGERQLGSLLAAVEQALVDDHARLVLGLRRRALTAPPALPSEVLDLGPQKGARGIAAGAQRADQAAAHVGIECGGFYLEQRGG